MKTIITIDGNITKKNGEAFTKWEYEHIIDGIIKFLEKKDCMFGGGSDHLSERTQARLNKNS